ncbi:unnamed protein product [Diplocarpon coronariae]
MGGAARGRWSWAAHRAPSRGEVMRGRICMAVFPGREDVSAGSRGERRGGSAPAGAGRAEPGQRERERFGRPGDGDGDGAPSAPAACRLAAARGAHQPAGRLLTSAPGPGRPHAWMSAPTRPSHLPSTGQRWRAGETAGSSHLVRLTFRAVQCRAGGLFMHQHRLSPLASRLSARRTCHLSARRTYNQREPRPHDVPASLRLWLSVLGILDSPDIHSARPSLARTMHAPALLSLSLFVLATGALPALFGGTNNKVPTPPTLGRRENATAPAPPAGAANSTACSPAVMALAAGIQSNIDDQGNEVATVSALGNIMAQNPVDPALYSAAQTSLLGYVTKGIAIRENNQKITPPGNEAAAGLAMVAMAQMEELSITKSLAVSGSGPVDTVKGMQMVEQLKKDFAGGIEQNKKNLAAVSFPSLSLSLSAPVFLGRLSPLIDSRALRRTRWTGLTSWRAGDGRLQGRDESGHRDLEGAGGRDGAFVTLAMLSIASMLPRRDERRGHHTPFHGAHASYMIHRIALESPGLVQSCAPLPPISAAIIWDALLGICRKDPRLGLPVLQLYAKRRSQMIDCKSLTLSRDAGSLDEIALSPALGPNPVAGLAAATSRDAGRGPAGPGSRGAAEDAGHLVWSNMCRVALGGTASPSKYSLASRNQPTFLASRCFLRPPPARKSPPSRVFPAQPPKRLSPCSPTPRRLAVSPIAGGGAAEVCQGNKSAVQCKVSTPRLSPPLSGVMQGCKQRMPAVPPGSPPVSAGGALHGTGRTSDGEPAVTTSTAVETREREQPRTIESSALPRLLSALSASPTERHRARSSHAPVSHGQGWLATLAMILLSSQQACKCGPATRREEPVLTTSSRRAVAWRPWTPRRLSVKTILRAAPGRMHGTVVVVSRVTSRRRFGRRGAGVIAATALPARARELADSARDPRPLKIVISAPGCADARLPRRVVRPSSLGIECPSLQMRFHSPAPSARCAPAIGDPSPAHPGPPSEGETLSRRITGPGREDGSAGQPGASGVVVDQFHVDLLLFREFSMPVSEQEPRVTGDASGHGRCVESREMEPGTRVH